MAGETSGAETILLVDDERGIREFARAALERQGFHVLVAESGEDALRVAATFPGTIALLVTDVRMPGIQGPELAAQLRALRQGLRVLLMSGYAEGVTPETLEDMALLEKPFLPSVLTRAVRQALERDC
jgi:two-component system cell cycle sensor histidine kinase/response regulator CckA